MMNYLPIILFSLIPLLAAVYVGWRLIAPRWHGLVSMTLWVSLLLGAAAFPVVVLRPFGFVPAQKLWGVVLMFAMGWLSIALFFTLIRELVLFIGYWVEFFYARWQKRRGRLQTYAAYDKQQHRRLFLKESSRLGVFALSAGAFGRGAMNAHDMQPTVVEVDVPISNLPQGLQGVRIVQISDVHIGQIRHEARIVEAVVRQINELNADIVVLTGDITDGKVADLQARCAPLGQIRAKLGRYFVTGNHEYYSDKVEHWLSFWAQQGYQTLQNQHHVLTINGEPLVIAGVNDLRSGTHPRGQTQALVCSPQTALKDAPNAPTVLLAHHPDTALLTEGLRVDVQLSGHTHGGQYFPGTFLIRWVHKFKAGLNRYRNAWVYVNSGTGYWGPALRSTDVLSEITVLTLKKA